MKDQTTVGVDVFLRTCGRINEITPGSVRVSFAVRKWLEAKIRQETLVRAVAEFAEEQGVDRALADMGYAFVLQGVLTGPSIKGGAFEGRTIDRFWVFDIYDNEEKQTLSPSNRVAFCREAEIPNVSLVARQFPLFEKVQTLEPLLKTATLPNKVGGVRHGLVFRSFREGREIWFELENPEYEPCPDQRMLDERFRDDLEATS